MKKLLIVIILFSHMSLMAYEMKIKKGWQLLGAVEPINMMTIFEERCINSIFTYKNSEWLEYSFDGSFSPYKYNIINSFKKGDGFWINGKDINCSVSLYESIEPILTGRTGSLGSFSYNGQNIITLKESFQSVKNDIKNIPVYGDKWNSVLEKTSVDFEKNNVFLNVFQFAWCNYQTVIDFKNSIYRINTNFTNYKCGDSATAFLMVYRVSKEIKSFEIQSFKLDSNDGGLTTVENR